MWLGLCDREELIQEDLYGIKVERYQLQILHLVRVPPGCLSLEVTPGHT